MNSIRKFLGQFNRYDYLDQSGSESCCMLLVDPLFEYIIIADPPEAVASSFVCFHLETIIPQVFSSFDLNTQTVIYESISHNKTSPSSTQKDEPTKYENTPLLRLHVLFSENRQKAHIQEWEITRAP